MRLNAGLPVYLALAALVGGWVAPVWADEKIQVIQAAVRTEDWRGWDKSTPIPASAKQVLIPEKFVRTPAKGHHSQIFSGKVIGLAPDQKAEIGVVSMVGVQWSDNNHYEWFALPASREFSVRSTGYPEARKALVVRAEGSPWTFLRAEFSAGEGATGIELRAKPGIRVIVTMEDAAGDGVSTFATEIFNAYRIRDDRGKELGFQRMGKGATSGGVLTLDLPPEPVALRLDGGPKIAAYYAVVDARDANHFHFKMLEASCIKGTVTRDGKPVVNETVYAVNSKAPMSASTRKTDAAGKFEMSGRMPGAERVTIGTYQTELKLASGETADLKVDLSAPTAR